MSKFLFLFGNTPQLSLLELNSVYPQLKAQLLSAEGELANRLAVAEMTMKNLKKPTSSTNSVA